MKNICVLIPSYNEAKTIGALVRAVKAKGYVVYVVDDGSTDGSALIAMNEGAVVVRHKVNKGKGASLREGFSHVLKKGYEAVVVMDGDNQHEVEDIGNLITRMEATGADMIIGNRMQDTSRMPKVRILVNSFMSFMISVISGQRLPDTQCGFRIISRRALGAMRLLSSNYEIESEMIIQCARAGFRMESAPIKTVYEDQISKINPFVDTMRFIGFLIHTAMRR